MVWARPGGPYLQARAREQQPRPVGKDAHHLPDHWWRTAPPRMNKLQCRSAVKSKLRTATPEVMTVSGMVGPLPRLTDTLRWPIVDLTPHIRQENSQDKRGRARSPIRRRALPAGDERQPRSCSPRPGTGRRRGKPGPEPHGRSSPSTALNPSRLEMSTKLGGVSGRIIRPSSYGTDGDGVCMLTSTHSTLWAAHTLAPGDGSCTSPLELQVG